MAEQQSGWAEGEHEPPQGPFVKDIPPPRGFFVTDMPVGRPVIPAAKKIKGVAGPTTDGPDGDYRPGQGTWSSA